MKKASENESKGVYPADSRLIIYRHLLSILYQQNKISKATYADSRAHVERAMNRYVNSN